MDGEDSDRGVAKAIGGVLVGVILMISLVSKAFLLALGVIAVGVLIGGTAWAISAYNDDRAAAELQARIARELEAVAANRAGKLTSRQQTDGISDEANTTLFESAQTAVRQVCASEAAREGWLGDVDFSADIREIADYFEKARELRNVTAELSALNNPAPEDRKLLAEAKTTTDNLENAAFERIELIRNCATEARLIDQSLRDEREETRTAEQRAQLRGKLSALLYGIEAAPDTTPTGSAADAVMARVHAYREIKDQIQQAREN